MCIWTPITVSYDHKVGDWPTGLENPELVKMKPSPVSYTHLLGFCGECSEVLSLGWLPHPALRAAPGIRDHKGATCFIVL